MSLELGYLNLPDVVCKEIISYLSAKDIGRLLMTCKTITKLVTNHVWHHLIKKDFPNTDITVELSTKSGYASLYALHLAHSNDVSRLQSEQTRLESELTKTRCLLDTTNADVNNMLDEKSTRITKFKECAFSVIYKKKLVQSKDKFVYVHNQHGRPSHLISISKPELGSSKTSSSSIRK